MCGVEHQPDILICNDRCKTGCNGHPRFGIAQKRREPGRLGSRQFLRSCDQLGAEAHVQRKLRRRDRLLAQRAQVDRQGPAIDARLVEIQREIEDLGVDPEVPSGSNQVSKRSWSSDRTRSALPVTNLV